MNDLSNLLFRPTLDEPAGEWLEKNIYLSREVSPNNPGKLDLSRQPWMRGILEAVVNPRVREINLLMGAQNGKSLCLQLSWMLLAMFYPSPCLISLADDDLTNRFVKQRLLPLILSNNEWSKNLQFAASGTHSVSDTLEYAGMRTFFTGSRSASKLSSFPAKYLILDEVSKFQGQGTKEAHPLLLVKERVKSFPSHKMLMASTPNVIEDPYYQEYLHSSQSHYWMPCPHCGEFFEFEFSTKNIVWDNSGSFHSIRNTARYLCPHCQGEIWDKDKAEIMSKGEWRSRSNWDEDSGHMGFHLNSLYSPFVSFGDVAIEFVKASKSIIKREALKNFYNSWLALPWEDEALNTSEADIRGLVKHEVLKGEIPIDTDYLVLGMDCGVHKQHWVVSAVCQDGRVQVVDWGVIPAYNSRHGYGPNKLLEDLKYSRDGEDYFIDVGFIDAGYSTQSVYEECLMNRTPDYLRPCKGTTGNRGSWGINRTTYDEELKLNTYDRDTLHSYAYDLIKDGKVILPMEASIDKDFLHQMSGQKLVMDKKGKWSWKDIEEDHFYDAFLLTIYSSWQFRAPDRDTE